MNPYPNVFPSNFPIDQISGYNADFQSQQELDDLLIDLNDFVHAMGNVKPFRPLTSADVITGIQAVWPGSAAPVNSQLSAILIFFFQWVIINETKFLNDPDSTILRNTTEILVEPILHYVQRLFRLRSS